MGEAPFVYLSFSTNNYRELLRDSQPHGSFVEPQASNPTVSYRRSHKASSNFKVRPLSWNSYSAHGILTVLKSQYGFRKNRAPINSNVLSVLFLYMLVAIGIYSTSNFLHI